MPSNPQPTKLVHVNPSISDTGQGRKFYGELLGLNFDTEHRPSTIVNSSQGPGSDRSRWHSHMLTARGNQRFHLDDSQFRYPLPSPATSTPYPTATHLGIAHIGLEIDDLDSCEAIVDAAVSSDVELTKVHNSEQRDLGDAGTRRVLCS